MGRPIRALVARAQRRAVDKRKPRWGLISIYANIAVAVIALLYGTGSYIEHLSDTDPQFCASCHIMQPYVNSYLTGSNLDHVHEEAGVTCKECHDYGLSAEVRSAFDYFTGNYEVTSSGSLPPMKFGDSLCTKCHVSEQHVAQLTDFLAENPHDSHMGYLACSTCHVSHGPQIDYCGQCHSDGGQRMIGGPITPRGTIGGSPTGTP